MFCGNMQNADERCEWRKDLYVRSLWKIKQLGVMLDDSKEDKQE